MINKNSENNDVRTFALGKINYILIAIAFALVIIGFALMAGGSSTPDSYNPLNIHIISLYKITIVLNTVAT